MEDLKEEKKPVTFNIPVDLATDYKVFCARNGYVMELLAAAAIKLIQIAPDSVRSAMVRGEVERVRKMMDLADEAFGLSLRTALRRAQKDDEEQPPSHGRKAGGSK